MQRGERIRASVCFALFGGLLAALFLRLGWLQVVEVEKGRRSVARQRDRFEKLPLPRGTIQDRRGRVLAYDRPVVEVRAEAHARVQAGESRMPIRFADLLSTRLTAHLMADPQRTPADRRRIRTAIRRRILRSKARPTPGGGYLRVEFLVATDLDSYLVLKRLLEEQEAWNQRGSKLPGRLYVNWSRQYVRTYPQRELTMGPVGFHARQLVHNADGTPRRDFGGGMLVRNVATGMEGFSGLWPGAMIPEGVRPAWYPRQGQGCLRGQFIVPGRGRFYAGREVELPEPLELCCTLDLALQRAAQEQLQAASEAIQQAYGTPESWGALTVVEVATGDVLALVSRYPGKRQAAFAPIQNLFEPGSVVKPLIMALALEHGVVSWEEIFDCTPTEPHNGWRVPDTRRVIHDDHACGHLDPRGILVNSSNIGAVQVGLRLGRPGLKLYLDSYQFGHKTGIGLPGEQKGGPNKQQDLDKISERSFRVSTGPSLSFGNELTVTCVQLARAYLSLLSGRQRELRLVKAVTVADRHVEAPAPRMGPRFLSRDTVARIRQALVGVVSEEEGATGARVHALLKSLGYEGSVLGGKTGTSTVPGTRRRTATFVGFAPAANPRWLAVCVLRKEGADRFYGGKYAGPPAAQVLLAALSRTETR
jgi:cell division protein FtsI/penicillin-binding protein 2